MKSGDLKLGSRVSDFS